MIYSLTGPTAWALAILIPPDDAADDGWGTDGANPEAPDWAANIVKVTG